MNPFIAYTQMRAISRDPSLKSAYGQIATQSVTDVKSRIFGYSDRSHHQFKEYSDNYPKTVYEAVTRPGYTQNDDEPMCFLAYPDTYSPIDISVCSAGDIISQLPADEMLLRGSFFGTVIGSIAEKFSYLTHGVDGRARNEPFYFHAFQQQTVWISEPMACGVETLHKFEEHINSALPSRRDPHYEVKTYAVPMGMQSRCSFDDAYRIALAITADMSHGRETNLGSFAYHLLAPVINAILAVAPVTEYEYASVMGSAHETVTFRGHLFNRRTNASDPFYVRINLTVLMLNHISPDVLTSVGGDVPVVDPELADEA